MRISRDDAAAALADIDAATGRARERFGYGVSGPIVMLWGVIWALGYTAMGLLPGEQWGWVWLVLDVIGITLTMIMASRARIRGASGVVGATGPGWRVPVATAAIFAFVAGTFAVLQPSEPAAFMVFPGILGGFIYFIVGMARQPRFMVIGAAVFAATLVGFFFFQPILAFWMAGVGFFGLVLGGLWMRSAA